MVRKRIGRYKTLYQPKRFTRNLLAKKQEQRIIRELLQTFRLWRIGVNERHKLLRLCASQFEKMKYGAGVPREKETIFCIIEIRKIARALDALLGKNNHAITHWIHSPNQSEIFGGQKAIDLMCEDPKNLSLVRQYIEYHAYNGW